MAVILGTGGCRYEVVDHLVARREARQGAFTDIPATGAVVDHVVRGGV